MSPISKINADLAYRCRQRGLPIPLPVTEDDYTYDPPRLKTIAEEMVSLLIKLNALDCEVREMYTEWHKKNPGQPKIED